MKLLGSLALGVAGLGLLAAVSAPASAATFGIRVLDQAGDPVVGASVCFGLEGNHKQFGAVFTNDEGIATTSVPNVPLTVTVSKTRFSGLRVQEPARGFNLIKDMTLIEGAPGPRCRAESALAFGDGQAIRIRDVDVSQGQFSTILQAQVTGEPTHYRVAADRNFTGANWQDYSNSIPVPQQLADASELYIQMRRFSGSNSRAWLESRSDVTAITLSR